MLNDIFNGSLALAAAGFILLCSSSPETPRAKITQMMERVASLSSKSGAAAIMPNFAYSGSAHHACNRQSYQLTLVNMQDYYDTVPDYGTIFLR